MNGLNIKPKTISKPKHNDVDLSELQDIVVVTPIPGVLPDVIPPKLFIVENEPMSIFIGNTSTRIGKHFIHKEVVKSQTAERLGLENFVRNQDVFDNATALAVNVLDPLREHYGSYSPGSWFRGEALEFNICVGGFAKWCKDNVVDPKAPDAWAAYFKRKQHPKGAAADIEINGVDNDTLYAYIKNNLEFDQLIREFRKEGDPMSGWVHVSWDRHGANRNQAIHIG
jgi:zinc D-Ala-D-Ala carboxypeptidase